MKHLLSIFAVLMLFACTKNDLIPEPNNESSFLMGLDFCKSSEAVVTDQRIWRDEANNSTFLFGADCGMKIDLSGESLTGSWMFKPKRNATGEFECTVLQLQINQPGENAEQIFMDLVLLDLYGEHLLLEFEGKEYDCVKSE